MTLTIADPEAADENGRPIRIVRRMETNPGDLCADAYRDQSGADIGFEIGGGIRTEIAAGDITLGDILRIHPFGNAVCMIEEAGRSSTRWNGAPGRFPARPARSCRSPA